MRFGLNIISFCLSCRLHPHLCGEHGDVVKLPTSPLLDRDGQEEAVAVFGEHWFLVLQDTQIFVNFLTSWTLRVRQKRRPFPQQPLPWAPPCLNLRLWLRLSDLPAYRELSSAPKAGRIWGFLSASAHTPLVWKWALWHFSMGTRPGQERNGLQPQPNIRLQVKLSNPARNTLSADSVSAWNKVKLNSALKTRESDESGTCVPPLMLVF